MVVKHNITFGPPIPIFIPDATEWCRDNCISTWSANYFWQKQAQNYSWIFHFNEEIDKVAFILRWL